MKTVVDMTGTRHEFPDNWTRERIEKAMASRPAPQGAANAADLNPDKLSPGPRWIGNVALPYRGQVREAVLNSIPAVGGTLGSLPGVLTADPPLAIYGAGLGGAAGRLGELGLRGAMGGPAAKMMNLPESGSTGRMKLQGPMRVAGAAGLAGGQQAANQTLGEVVPKVFGKGSAALYDAGVGQPANLTQKFPNVDFPTVAREEGAVVGSKVGGEGTATMIKAVRRSGRELRSLQREQAAAGASVPADHPVIRQKVNDLIEQIKSGDPTPDSKVAAIEGMWNDYLQSHGIKPAGPSTPSPIVDEFGGQIMTPGTPASRVDMPVVGSRSSQSLKTGSQGIASKLIQGRVSGARGPAEMGGLEKEFVDAIGAGHKAVLETLEPRTNAAGKTVEQLNRHTQSRIGGARAMRARELKSTPLFNPATGPALGFGIATAIHNPALGAAEFVGGHLGGRLLTNPRFLTGMGHFLDNQAVQQIPRHFLPFGARMAEMYPYTTQDYNPDEVR